MDQFGEPLGWKPVTGASIAPGMGERESWSELLIRPRLLEALRTLNPTVPVERVRQAPAELTAAHR